jgi:hypothetical protein
MDVKDTYACLYVGQKADLVDLFRNSDRKLTVVGSEPVPVEHIQTAASTGSPDATSREFQKILERAIQNIRIHPLNEETTTTCPHCGENIVIVVKAP